MKFRSGLVRITILLTLLVTLTITTSARAAGTCYVDDSATGANDGTSWADAYTSLQSAIADSCTEIWVAAGTYKPHASDRAVSFTLESGTAIYGGFAGTETMLNQRDPESNVTTLSGDLAGDDSGFTNNGENSYHVVTADTVDNTAVLDGFTINGGNANGSNPYDWGGGIYANSAGATLANLTLRYNTAAYGGGMFGGPFTASTLTNVTFKDNTSSNAGGGLYMTIATVSLLGVTFSNNTSYAGGGMAIANQLPTLTNVTFSGNTADLGGGLYLYSTQPTLTNVTFSGNSATVAGGGLYVEYVSAPKLTNVIIANSTNGDCVINSGSIDGTSSNNLIEDTASNACGLTNGVNGDIVGTDPGLGALADNGGATLTFLPEAGSAAIDAGTNSGCTATDQRGLSRPQNGTCDIGAVERDLVAPTVDTFTATTPSTNPIPITAFTATDTIGVTGYIITEDSTPPFACCGDWTTSAPTTYTTGTSAGTVTLYPWAKDRDGNISALFGSPVSVFVDAIPPVISSSVRVNNNPNRDASVDFSVTFSEFVSGVDTTDFTLVTSGVTGASITGVSGGPNTYIVSVNTGAGSGTIRLDVLDDDTISDTVGNTLDGGFTSGETFTIDKTAPTVSSIVRVNSNPSNASSVDFTVTFSESVNGVGSGDFSLTTSGTISGASVSGVTGSGTTYTVSVGTGTGDGTIRLDLDNDDSITDDASNELLGDFTSGETFTIDKTAPTVSSSMRVNSNPSNASSVDFTVTFSEAVSGVGTDDFSLTTSGAISGASVSSISGSGTTRTISVNTGSGSGTIRLDVLDDDSIVDTANNNLDMAYSSGESYIIDKTIPSISSSMRTNANPTSAVSVGFTVTFSESVSGVDMTDFSLVTTGVIGASISGVSGSGATYTVTVSTGTGNGTIRLDVPISATVTDTVGNVLTGLPYTSGASYTINKTLTFTSTAAQDGWLLETSELSSIGGTLNSTATIFNLGDDASKKQYRGILSFKTSTIPDAAVITGVTLKVKKQGVTGGGNPVSIFQGFFADVKTGFFGTGSALQTTDFQATASKTVGPTSPTPSANWYSLNLAGAKTFINKLSSNGGVTQIRLRFKLDDNNNTIANYLSLFSGNAGAADRPQLVITYYVP